MTSTPYVAQRVGPVDDRGELASLQQLSKGLQVLLAWLGGQHPQPLADQPCRWPEERGVVEESTVPVGDP